jgi:hypothetical protein
VTRGISCNHRKLLNLIAVPPPGAISIDRADIPLQRLRGLPVGEMLPLGKRIEGLRVDNLRVERTGGSTKGPRNRHEFAADSTNHMAFILRKSAIVTNQTSGLPVSHISS